MAPKPSFAPIKIHQSAQKDLPDRVDWREKGAVSPVLNQGQSGSSWAIPAVSAVEGAQAIKAGHLVPLSVQQMLDCCKQNDEGGSTGGLIEDGYKVWVCLLRYK